MRLASDLWDKLRDILMVTLLMFVILDCQIEKLDTRQGGYRYARVGAEWLRTHFGLAGRLQLLCALDRRPAYRYSPITMPTTEFIFEF